MQIPLEASGIDSYIEIGANPLSKGNTFNFYPKVIPCKYSSSPNPLNYTPNECTFSHSSTPPSLPPEAPKSNLYPIHVQIERRETSFTNRKITLHPPDSRKQETVVGVSLGND